MEVATILRKEYRKDVEKSFSDTEKCFAVDMQKVIMLPVMCGVKSCLFTPRLTTYHLTFAPLGGKTHSKEKPTGVIWHDEISGRKDEDVTSGYIKLLKSLRDVRDVLIWADNCSSQKKCWTLYTALVFYLNSPGVLLTTLTIKYFEPGHTFMAADSFHHVVESKIRSKKFVMDFDDFTAIIQEKGNAICMKSNDFTSYENKMSSAKFTNHPLLEDVTVVRFEKYSTKMFWKSRIDDVEFKSGEFLQKKIIAAIASGKQHSFPSREVNGKR